jgi:hypothetical protein
MEQCGRWAKKVGPKRWGRVVSEPGKTSEPETASGSFRERLASTKKAWGVLGVGLGVLTLGIGGYIQSLLQPYFSVWQIIWSTLPLAVAVAIISFTMSRDISLSGGAVIAIILGTFLASVLTGVTAGTRVFNYLFHAQYHCFSAYGSSSSQICYQSGYSAPNGNIFLEVLSGYVHIYGVIGFVRSVLVGLFLGYGVSKLVGGTEPRKTEPRKTGVHK